MADWEGVIELMRRMHAEIEFTRSPFSDQALRRMAERNLTPAGKGASCALLAEQSPADAAPVLTGTLIANAGQYFFSEAIGATAMAFYVRPENRGGMAAVKLLHAFRKWADNRGATSATVNVTSGIHMARSDKLLKRLGFNLTGGNYMTALAFNVEGSVHDV